MFRSGTLRNLLGTALVGATLFPTVAYGGFNHAADKQLLEQTEFPGEAYVRSHSTEVLLDSAQVSAADSIMSVLHPIDFERSGHQSTSDASFSYRSATITSEPGVEYLAGIPKRVLVANGQDFLHILDSLQTTCQEHFQVAVDEMNKTLDQGFVTSEQAKKAVEYVRQALSAYSQVKGLYFFAKEKELSRFQLSDGIDGRVRLIDADRDESFIFPEVKFMQFVENANKAGFYSVINQNPFGGFSMSNTTLSSKLVAANTFLENAIGVDTTRYTFNPYLMDFWGTGEEVHEYLRGSGEQDLSEFFSLFAGFGLFTGLLWKLGSQVRKRKKKAKAVLSVPEKLDVAAATDVWSVTPPSSSRSDATSIDIWNLGE